MAGLVALVLAGCDHSALLIQTGSRAPAFSLLRLDGTTASFPAGYQGRIVAVRFWADWCPYCLTEMRDLEPVWQRYRDRGLAFLAVNVMQPRGQVERFARELDLRAEVLLDTDGSVTRAYGVMGLPVTVFIDRQGIVRGRIVGESTPEAFVRVVESLLGPQTGGSREPQAAVPEAVRDRGEGTRDPGSNAVRCARVALLGAP